MNTDTKVIYEFGPFRMDPDKQVLLRDGRLVAVTPKAFETLLVLVRRSREVVSKEELLKEIWPDSFVEEANLSQHIFKLRKALGDTVEGERYIVTLPGRGYRFAVPVRTIAEGGDVLIAQMRSRAQILIEEDAPEPVELQAVLPPPAPSKPKWPRWMLASGAAVAVAAIGSLLLLQRHRINSLDSKDAVLIADFTNRTGDPVFDDALRQGLEVQLQQSPYLNLVSEDLIQKTLRLMSQPPGTRVTGQVAREVCLRTGSAAMLEGSIQSVGAQYLLNLWSTNCRAGDVIDREQAQVVRKEEVLGAITRMTTRFRKRVGESAPTLEKHDVPLAEATTASIDALKAYSLGLQAIATHSEDSSIPYFKHAIEIDPKFAMAYSWLALLYGASGSSALATENARKAYELADRVSDNERFFISAYYYGRAAGNQEKARQICEEWAETYPRDPSAHGFLTGFIYPALANFDGAIEHGRTVVELAPDVGNYYYLLGVNFLYAGRLSESEETLSRAYARKMQNHPKLLTLQYDLAFIKGDRERMEQAVQAAQGQPEAMDWLADRQAYSFAYAGRLQKARALSRQAVELAQQQGDHERAAEFAIRSALWEAFYGNAREAKQGVTAALRLASNREVEYGAAIAAGLAGDSKQAEALAGRLESEFPEDTSIRFSYLPVIRAILALKRNDPAGAMDALEPATPYELGAPRGAVTCFFGSLYPILFRGEAYLAAHKGPEAAREFQKLLDHRGTMTGDPVSVLAGYGLARSYALSGDTRKARHEYEDFLALWKDADPDLPLLHQARAEFASLQ
jgi:eukaryotic-like serine/threonine-protein kinase